MALVDANYKFNDVDMASYGKNSDGEIFTNSNFEKALEKKSIKRTERKKPAWYWMSCAFCNCWRLGISVKILST